jgi:hypothetical protein
MTYTVVVVGHLWSGPLSSYEYEFYHEPTEAEIKAKAGDFQSVDDYQVTKVERSNLTSNQGRTRTYTIVFDLVRPFDKASSRKVGR